MSWPDARAVAASVAATLPQHLVPLPEAVGSVLAEALVSRVDLPPFDTAAMDGWAVVGPGPWTVVGESRAGQDLLTLTPGQAVRISTGAVVPVGAGVLRSEHGSETAGVLSCQGPPPPPGHDVRRRGEEIRTDETVLQAGTVLTPPAVGLAAAAGHDRLAVVPAPRVALAVLGDELTTSGVPTGGGVRDALSPQLPAWVSAMGGVTVDLRHVPDRLDATREAFSVDADVVVTTGGTARGPADHVRAAVADLGGTWHVDGVQVRPGHPMKLGGLPEGRLLVALPGNPLAAVSALLTLAAPALGALEGRTLPVLRRVRLTTAVDPHPTAHRLIPGRWHADGVEPSTRRGPAMLSGVSTADLMVVVPPGTGTLPSGSEVEVMALPWTSPPGR
jgi:molybdopterin molybdotransferase